MLQLHLFQGFEKITVAAAMAGLCGTGDPMRALDG
jgi:hypothetical protein